MKTYQLILERIVEEIIEVEADSEDEAYTLVTMEGHGALVNLSEWAPTLISSMEI